MMLYLVLHTVIFGGIAILMVGMSIATLMSVATLGADGKPVSKRQLFFRDLFLYSHIFYPFVTAFVLILSWIAVALGWERVAFGLGLVPLLHLILFGLSGMMFFRLNAQR